MIIRKAPRLNRRMVPVDSIRRAIPRRSIKAGPIQLNPFLILLGIGELERRLHRRYRWLNRSQYPIIMVVALVMAYSASIGQWVVLAYAIVVLLFRIDSRQPFAGALILLVAIPTFQLIGLSYISENIAIYAYELLVVGVIRAIVELPKKGAK
ncbi:MAG TPA: hypothetical protein VMR98_02630 [Candidatus Polarisedimenticolaceae bacterium]|nr:hypothetical protein [Candidatus Polarisedimenticolaceae bacterium]